MTKHIMLDTETWGTAPGCDLRSIGACLFDPVTGRVAGFDDPLIDIGAQFTFHVACNNPLIGTYSRDHLTQAQLDEIGGVYRKYNLTRDPQTVNPRRRLCRVRAFGAVALPSAARHPDSAGIGRYGPAQGSRALQHRHVS
jgi:hypothetical protein